MSRLSQALNKRNAFLDKSHLATNNYTPKNTKQMLQNSLLKKIMRDVT